MKTEFSNHLNATERQGAQWIKILRACAKKQHLRFFVCFILSKLRDLQTIARSRGSLFVLALLATAFLLAGLTWWHYSMSNPSTRDAVMIVFSTSEEKQPPAVDSIPSTEKERAELEMALLIEDFDNARKAIENALAMVEEQRENFSFAHERYERLMPLVETGALDPLSASQIQSAYISARASLAQAKYLLAQAQRDYGTPEYRNAQLKLLRARFPVLGEATAIEAPSLEPNNENNPQAVIEAVFTGPAARQLSSGMLARVTFPSYSGIRLQGRISQVSSITVPNQLAAVRVTIPIMELPQVLHDRKTAACQVSIDMTLTDR